jgi:hypothetical protein
VFQRTPSLAGNALDDARFAQMRQELQMQLNQNMQTEFSRMREYLNQLYHPQSFRHD